MNRFFQPAITAVLLSAALVLKDYRLAVGQYLKVSHSQGKLLRWITLFLFAALAVTSVDAASYEKNNGTIVNPIQIVPWEGGGDHSYSGNNLEPSANLTSANLTGANLTSANLTDAILTGADLSDTNLYGANLTSANLTDANLTDASLFWAVLDDADFSGADLTGADARNASMNGAILDDAILAGSLIYEGHFVSAASVTGVNLTGHDMSGWDLAGVDLTGATLTSANLTDATLTGADLTSATLTGATLTNADLNGANLTGSTISESQFLSAASVTGVNLTGHTMNGWDLTGADLTGANLSSAVLTSASLTNADLNGANLTGSTISESQFLSAASVTGVNLTGHTMNGWDLTGADLTGANLSSADLAGANLHQALLPSAMASLPVINGAVVTVANTLAVSGSVQVDTGGNLSVTSDSFTAVGGVNIEGGTVQAAIFGLDLDQIGDVSGYGRLFGDVDLGASGAIAGSGAGLELFGHVSGSGTISGTTLFGNLDIGSSPGAITLEDVTLSAAGTTTFEVGGTDASQFDRLTLVGSVALDGTAQISFDSFTPDPSDTFQLIDLTGGTASNWFSSVVAPAGWTLSSSGLLAIPEPHTLLLASLASMGLTLRRRRWAR